MKEIVVNLLSKEITNVSVSGSVNSVRLKITDYPDSFRNLSVYALFLKNEKSIQRMFTDDIVDVPNSMMQDDKPFKVGIFAIGSDASTPYRETIEYFWIRQEEGLWTADDILTQGDIDTFLQWMAIIEGIREEEASRVQTENERVYAESIRIQNENTRLSSEESRLADEAQRVENERQRSEAETQRINAESERKVAEEDRKNQMKSLSEVAKTGNYADLLNKPIVDIGVINNMNELLYKEENGEYFEVYDNPGVIYCYSLDGKKGYMFVGEKASNTYSNYADRYKIAIMSSVAKFNIYYTGLDSGYGYVSDWHEVNLFDNITDIQIEDETVSSHYDAYEDYTSGARRKKVDITNPIKTLINKETSLLASKNYVNVAIADLVNSAPETLDTLNEIATALGNDPNFATTILNQLAQKADISYVDEAIQSAIGEVLEGEY